jgi:hypothetical protein
VSADRYYLLLAADGRPAQRGWWGSEEIAREKFAAWVGGWGREGVRLTLTDEETGQTLTTWPARHDPLPSWPP